MAALALYAAFLAIALLAPTSGSQSEGATWLGDLLTSLGLPDRFATQPRMEFLANALILMPVSALGSLSWPSTNWRDWTACAFAVSGLVEVIQGLALPERTASFADVAANTLGGLGGAVIVLVLRRLRELRTAGAP